MAASPPYVAMNPEDYIVVRAAVQHSGTQTFLPPESDTAQQLADQAKVSPVAFVNVDLCGSSNEAYEAWIVEVSLPAGEQKHVKTAVHYALGNNGYELIGSPWAPVAVAEIPDLEGPRECIVSVPNDDVVIPEQCRPGQTYMLSAQCQDGQLRGDWIRPEGRIFAIFADGARSPSQSVSASPRYSPSPPYCAQSPSPPYTARTPSPVRG